METVIMKYSIHICVYISVFFMTHNVSASSCLLRNTCAECITDSEKCVWCAMTAYNGTRCKSAEEEDLNNWCYNGTVNPESSGNATEDRPFDSSIGNVVQIKPQNIKINLRPRFPHEFKFFINLAKDYPVDLYFLLDGSIQKQKLKQIVQETETVYRKMQGFTKYVFLGTGLFINKNTLPFTRINNTTSTYSYRNRLNLTDNFELFQNVVSNTIMGNNPDPENSALDALAQVIVCDEIGWHKESTKIIMVITDSRYHSVGEGYWAGINKPYDGKCYTKNGIYEKELEYDYPSPSIINKMASDAEIIILFMVEGHLENVYTSLSKAISGSRVVTYNSGDRLNVLTNRYKEIRRHLKLKLNMDTNYREYFKITFNPDCLKNSEKECKIHPKKQQKPFQINGTIELLKHFDFNKLNIDIVFEGNNEKLKLNIDVIKDCDCEVEENSKYCNSSGTLRCGSCECNPDRYGNRCQCDKKSKPKRQNDKSTCTSPASNGTECSGHGSCSDCGQCLCLEGYSGRFCECHENSCKLYKGKRCSGNGRCECGSCVCDPGFIGKHCDCSLEDDNCKTGDTMCTNKEQGKCVCNECHCFEPSEWDVRRVGRLCNLYCSDLKSCHSRQCQVLEPIVLCYLKQKECRYDKAISFEKIKNFNRVNGSVKGDLHCLNVRTDVGCYTRFLYRYKEDGYGIFIKVQTDTNCAESYYMYGGACVGGLILIGVITLITWKCITDKRDRLEYERFVKEAGITTSACDNPIYSPATSTFHNPGFRRRSCK